VLSVRDVLSVKGGPFLALDSACPWRLMRKWAIFKGAAAPESNPEYMKLSEGGASLFLPGSVHDEMWRSA
jgi:hypothetical protein